MRKKIGILVAQVDEATQHKFLDAFIAEAYKEDFDVYIFSMHQKYQETHLRCVGDSNIYELINFSMFDAVVCLIDTIQIPDYNTVIEKKIKDNFDGPVLIIDHESSQFDYVMMDHYTPFKALVDHLIEEHGLKKIAMLSGKKDHPHAVTRLNAFYDSMNEHGLEIKDEWIYHGNFWYNAGNDFARQLVESKNMPEAVVCANDCMAIGLASEFSALGLRIPEDIAIVGYDSLDEGKISPSPLTSADIPAAECGKYSFHYIYSMIMGTEKPVQDTKATLFMGGSCGCKCERKLIPEYRRATWATDQAAKSVFSDFNHILEDLLSATDMESFIGTMKYYLYQIEPYARFDLCFNDHFMNPEYTVGQHAVRNGYTDKMYNVLSSDRIHGEKPSQDLKRSFMRENLLPYDDSERDYPTTYVFNSVYFDDKSFGYTIFNSGKSTSLYGIGFRIWMRNVMQGLESFFRQQYMKTLLEKMQSSLVRDSLTGLYNYEGFIKEVEELEDCTDTYTYDIKILAVDIIGLRSYNEMNGRDFGDRCIKMLAKAITDSIDEEDIAARMCNDEFLIAFVDLEDGSRGDEIIDTIKTCLKNQNLFLEDEKYLDIHHSEVSQKKLNNRNKEDIINYCINTKNHIKRQDSSNNSTNDVADEIRQTQLVDNILNQNLLTYFYQPIVNAKDGSIFAYEALMRHVHGKVSPAHIIKSATYLKRLGDVEKLTFLNVTEDVVNNIDSYNGRKVFINSLPGVPMSDEVRNVVFERIDKYRDIFVVEFTEENEMDDENLKKFEQQFDALGIEKAIDDYGVGYSNVGNLLRYAPQYVKIDRVLVTDVHENPQKQHLIRSTVDFARKNNIKTLAEGVETADELRECIMLGVDLIQGYYTGRPQREVVEAIPDNIRDEIIRYSNQAKEWQLRIS